MKRYIALAVVVLAAAACDGASVPPRSTPSPINTGAASATTAPTTATPPASGPSAEIELQITDGPHDGSYRAVANGACHNDSAQNRFSVSYSNNAAPDGFVALDLVLNDMATAADDSSDDFVAHISVGGANSGVSYSIAPRAGDGDGNAFIDMAPSTVTLDVEMDARDGATINLTVLCDLP